MIGVSLFRCLFDMHLDGLCCMHLDDRSWIGIGMGILLGGYGCNS